MLQSLVQPFSLLSPPCFSVDDELKKNENNKLLASQEKEKEKKKFIVAGVLAHLAQHYVSAFRGKVQPNSIYLTIGNLIL